MNKECNKEEQEARMRAATLVSDQYWRMKNWRLRAYIGRGPTVRVDRPSGRPTSNEYSGHRTTDVLG